jgi:hypothetical protein
MAIIPFPSGFVRAAGWRQEPTGGLQRSEWTGRTRAINIGPAARWACAASLRPSQQADMRLWRGFAGAMQSKANFTRVEATEGSQYGAADNLILNPEFESGSAPWVLSSAWSRDTSGLANPFPVWALYTDSTRATDTATANSSARIGFGPGNRLFLSAYAIVASSPAGFVPITADFYNASNVFISTLTVDLGPAAGSVGVWRYVRGFVTAPAGTASVTIGLRNQLTAGYCYATSIRAGVLPDACTAAAGSGGLALNLAGLQPFTRHLQAGDMLTVTLPSGDEQLITLTADLVAASGTATAALATPLREVPTAGALVYLSRPHALMRCADPMGWGVSPGGVYEAQSLELEESF